NRNIGVDGEMLKPVGWSKRSGLVLAGYGELYSLDLSDPECTVRTRPSAPHPPLEVKGVLASGDILCRLNTGSVLIDPSSMTGRSITAHKTTVMQHAIEQTSSAIRYLEKRIAFPSLDRPCVTYEFI